jgi:hypothetical protein
MADQQSSNGAASGAKRVESTLEDVGRKTGRFLAVAFARAREEAEDIWAEAQSIRKGERGESGSDR